MRAVTRALALCAGLPLFLGAQQDSSTAPPELRANVTGFFVGFDPLVYSALAGKQITAARWQGGTGIALRFGWGFSERWALVMDVPVTDIVVSDTASVLLSHGDVAMMFLPGRLRVGSRVLLPFVQAGFGFRSIDGRVYDGGTPRIYALEGEVLSIGLGARLHFTPALAMTLQGWWSTGDFNDERVSNLTTHNLGRGATSYRVQTGVEWHRRRARP